MDVSPSGLEWEWKIYRIVVHLGFCFDSRMEHSWVDEQLLEERLESVGDLFIELVGRFEQQWSQSGPSDGSSGEALAMELHKLAGTAGSLCMPRLAASLKAGEARSLAGEVVDWSELQELGRESFRRLRMSLAGDEGV